MAKHKISVLRKPSLKRTVDYFQEIKPFLIASLLLGIFPAENCFRDFVKGIKFKFFSWLHIISLTANILIFKCSSWLHIEIEHATYYRRWELVIRFEYIVWICLLHTIYKKVVKSIYQLQKFDAEFTKVKYTNSKNKVRPIYLICCIQLLIICYTFYLNFRYQKSFSYYVVRLFYFYMLNVRFWVFVPFIATTTAITKRFNKIAEELKELLFRKGLPHYQTLEEIQMLRCQHLQLCTSTNQFTNCYSFLLTVYFAVAYFDVMMKVNWLLNNSDLFDVFFDPPLFLNIVISSYAIISAADDVKQASQSMLTVLRDYPLADKPDEFYTEITQLVLQISTSTTEITASQFFLVEKKSIPSIVGSYASCLLVLIQLGSLLFKGLESE